MSEALNVTRAAFGGLREVTTAPLWQYDYGQILQITGLDLPQAFEVHFSNSRKSGETITQIGTDGAVTIPDMYLTSGADIYCFIFLHDGADDGETEYVIKIPVRERPEPSDIEPTPEQQDVITEAIAALNDAVTQTGQDVISAGASATAAAQSATDAQTAATQAQGSATAASASATTASTAAATATQKAGEAATSASNAASAKTAAETAETNAQAAQSASESAQASAESSAQTATTKASEASTSATSASGSASAASASASQASGSATSAANSATAASGSATAAAGSATTASTKASEASASATAAQTAQTAAEAAQTAAETAASTFETDTTLTVSGKAADAKAVGDDIRVLDESINGIISKNYTEGKNFVADSVSHATIDDPNTCISEMIEITWEWTTSTNTKFWFNGLPTDRNYYYQIFYYDANQQYLDHKGSYDNANMYRGVPNVANAKYVQFSFRKGTTGKITDNASTPTSTYWEAGSAVEKEGIEQKIGDLSDLDTENKTSIVVAINEVKEDIPKFPITPKDASFFHVSKNLIDPETCVNGEYVNQATGVFASGSGQRRTTYIEISPSSTYVIRKDSGALGNNFRYVFYTENKTYISGALGTLPNMVLTSPANAKYIAISDNTDMQYCMIAPFENEDKSFEFFDNTYVLNKYIKDKLDGMILNIPDKIYAVVGIELNVFFENITEDWEKYHWDVTCTKGKQMERGYNYTPTVGDDGEYPLTIRAYIDEKTYKEISTTLVVSPVNTASGVSVIVLGDSTTDNGTAVAKLHTDFESMGTTVQTLGTRGTSPNKHEGRSGWKFQDYCTVQERSGVSNPFYNPNTQTFDASYYFSNSGIAEPDWFIINLGINDVFGYTTDSELETWINRIITLYVDPMIDSLQNAVPNMNIGLCLTIPPNTSQDAFGKAYGCNQTRDRYKRNNAIWVSTLIDTYAGKEADGIYLVPIHTNLDTIYNMGMESIPVNARNTTTYQSPIGNGGVHPVESGYWQIADVYTAFLKANATTT